MIDRVMKYRAYGRPIYLNRWGYAGSPRGYFNDRRSKIREWANDRMIELEEELKQRAKEATYNWMKERTYYLASEMGDWLGNMFRHASRMGRRRRNRDGDGPARPSASQPRRKRSNK